MTDRALVIILAGRYGLGEKLNRKLVLAEEAAFLISDSIKNGYQVISF